MEITVHIPDEIAAQAREKGLSAESYVEQLVIEHISPREGRAAAGTARLDEFFEEMAAHSEKISPLPDEAFTRASYYTEHN